MPGRRVRRPIGGSIDRTTEARRCVVPERRPVPGRLQWRQHSRPVDRRRRECRPARIAGDDPQRPRGLRGDGAGSAHGLADAAGRRRDVPGPALPDLVRDLQRQVHSNIQIDYQANGSGAGIKAITEQTVDFGASDAAMKDDEIAKLPAGTKIVHIPTALGAVVVIYNLPGVTDAEPRRRRTSPGSSSATIKKWNDPAIAANNSGATLPDKDILVVHRSDGSGTTNAFTTLPRHGQPRLALEGRHGQGSQLADRCRRARATTAWPAAVKQTEGAVGLRRAQLRHAGRA